MDFIKTTYSLSLVIVLLLLLFSDNLFAQIDQQTYNYNSATNQLSYITDLVSDDASTNDIDNQASTNYAYDAIGQLTKDEAEGILSIIWTSAGKVKEVSIDDKPKDGVVDRTLNFKYDAAGNRIKKTEIFLTTSAPQLTTYYVRNVTGELMSIYQNDGSGIKRIEVPIGTGVDKTEEPLTASTEVYQPEKGNKYYQLNDHLSSVRTVVNDIKQSTLIGSTYSPGNYLASIVAANDYYSYGMQMPNRALSLVEGRYGFQGKEKDDAIKGDGNSYDFGARLYDPRLGKWLSVDPLAFKAASRTPYNAMGNDPINRIDPDGMEDWATRFSNAKKKADETFGTPTEILTNAAVNMTGIPVWLTIANVVSSPANAPTSAETPLYTGIGGRNPDVGIAGQMLVGATPVGTYYDIEGMAIAIEDGSVGGVVLGSLAFAGPVGDLASKGGKRLVSSATRRYFLGLMDNIDNLNGATRAARPGQVLKNCDQTALADLDNLLTGNSTRVAFDPSADGMLFDDMVSTLKGSGRYAGSFKTLKTGATASVLNNLGDYEVGVAFGRKFVDGNEVTGHFFNIVRQSDQVMVRDAQTGFVTSNLEGYMKINGFSSLDVLKTGKKVLDEAK